MSAKNQSAVEEISSNVSAYDALSLESLGTHLFYGVVDENSVFVATDFILKANILLRDLSNLTLIINTVGGSVNDGLGLIDLMNTSAMPIHTVGMGNVMSMGVLLLSAGKKGKRLITENTTVMAHQFHGGYEGKFHELVAQHKSAEYLQEQFIRHYEIHTKMDRKKIKSMLFGKTDMFLTPQQCVEYGIADEIISSYPPVFNTNAKTPRKRIKKSDQD